MMDISLTLEIIKNNSILISFLGGLFGGEEAILILSFMSANGLLPITYLYFFASIGVFISDVIIYEIGRTGIIHRIPGLRSLFKKLGKIDDIMAGWNKNHLFKLLISTKFIYGTRIITLMYLGNKKTDFMKFFYYDLITVFVWSLIYVTIGWLAGRGFNIALKIYNNIILSMIILILSVILMILLGKWMKRILNLLQEKEILIQNLEN